MTPCDVCRRCHAGPRCDPDVRPSICVTIPRYLLQAMEDAGYYWGDRSSYIAGLIEADLVP